MKFYRPFLLVLLFFICNLLAGEQDSGFEFLRLDFNPRSRSLSGSVFARGGDISSIRYNPAAMAGSDVNLLNLSYVDYLLDINGGQVLYSHAIAGIGQISTQVLFFNYGEFDEVLLFNSPTGKTYTANDLAVSISYANLLHKSLAAGVTIKYVNSTIHSYNASAVAIDAGLIYTLPFDRDLSLGCSILNAGKALTSFIEVRENLPFSINIGLAKKFSFIPLEINIGAQDLSGPVPKNRGWQDKIALGGELNISQLVFLRMGYNTQLYHDRSIGNGNSGFAFGAGVVFDNFKFDYCLSSLGILGNTHIIGLAYHFAASNKSKRRDMEQGLSNLPSAPEQVTVGAYGNMININWQEIPGLRYNVYSRHSSTQNWYRLNKEPIGGGSGHFKRAELSGMYFFLIRSVSPEGNEGPASDQIWIRLN